MSSNLPLNIYNPNVIIGGNVVQKADSLNSIVPKMTRPLTNGVDPNVTSGLDGNAFKARPLKHWRLQLSSTTGKTGSKLIRLDLINGPGGSQKLVNNDCTSCDKDNNGINVVKIDNFGSTKIYTENGCCNPQKNRIKSAQTVINPEKGYCSNYRQYLQKRCKTFNQKSFHYDADPAVTPANLYEPKTYKGNCCPDSTACRTTYYKPSNSTFAIQGATSSSNRIQQLKVNTVTKNANSFRSAYGAEFGNAVANAATYSGNPEAPYIVKSKTNFKCGILQSLFHRNGNKTACVTV
jgi:hypothetical protein